MDEEHFYKALEEITKLNPRPGASLGEAIGRNLMDTVPDFIVDTYDDGTINISLNNRNLPKELRMSRDFTGDGRGTYEEQGQSIERIERGHDVPQAEDGRRTRLHRRREATPEYIDDHHAGHGGSATPFLPRRRQSHCSAR